MNLTNLFFSLILILIAIFLFFAFLNIWLKRHQQLPPYLSNGLLSGGIFLGMVLLLFLLLSPTKIFLFVKPYTYSQFFYPAPELQTTLFNLRI